MSNTTLLRTLLIYSICLPLAIFLGYMIGYSPDASTDLHTYIGVGIVLFLLVLPLLLRWHRFLLIASWNAAILLYFVPGRPALFFALAWLSLTISILQYIVNPKIRFISVPSVARPLLFMATVVMVTARANGGIGLGALGSEVMGGKKYLEMLTAVVAFFALVAQPIPLHKAAPYIVIFFLGFLTHAIGELGPIIAPGFYFIFWLFPISEQSVTTMFSSPGRQEMMQRFSGITFACAGIYYALLARYGIRELFNSRRLFRLALLVLVGSAALLGGFRSTLIQFAATFAVLFYLEGLMRTRLLPLLLLVLAFSATLLIGFADRMPLNVQRTLTVVPGVQLDPLARASAESSSKWRWEMWRDVLPDVPKYFLLGKGFGLSAADIQKRIVGGPGELQSLSGEGSALAGDFHNGPLSLLIPFGVWGAIGFTWFVIASLKVLYRNYKFGHPDLQRLNTFLYAMFLVRAIFFYLVFGSVYSDLGFFVGIVGMGIAINGGVAKPVLVPQPVQQPIRIRRPLPRPVPAVT